MFFLKCEANGEIVCMVQGCKNMLTFLTPESPNFQSFLVLLGDLNENLEDIIINENNLASFEAQMSKTYG